MSFGQRLRERLGGAFNGKQQAEGLARTFGDDLITGLRDKRLSLSELASEQGTSVNTIRQALLKLVELKKMSSDEYRLLMERNSSLSQEKRPDLKNRRKEEKTPKPPRQVLPKGIPKTDPLPENRSPKEKTAATKYEDPQLTWLRVNLYESRWRKRNGTPDLDRLAIELRVKKNKVQQWKTKIDAELRQNAGR